MLRVSIAIFLRDQIPQNVLEQCSANFSNYYGIWQDKSKGRVKMSSSRLKSSLLSDESCGLVVAFDGNLDNVVGHAFFKVFHSVLLDRSATWFTQLVVQSEYRHQKIAQRMLHAAIGNECICAGLVSSHPFAVLALEKAMRLEIDVSKCKMLAEESIFQDSGISYLQDCNVDFANQSCLVNTSFFVDHEEPERALNQIKDWKLGQLKDGHEFLAIILIDS